MRKWFVVLGIVLVAVSVFVFRTPESQGNQTTVNGYFVSERIMEYHLSFSVGEGGLLSRKTISVNSSDWPLKVRVLVTGNLSGITKSGPVFLEGPGNVSIVFESDKEGFYEGSVHVFARRYNYWFMDWMTAWL